MTRSQLVELIRQKKSCLCVGLDTDIAKVPAFLLNEENPQLAFNKHIIDHTRDYAVAYKINTAFYESQGLKGWEAIQGTLDYLPEDVFAIADAKRGDIGNTGEHYARTFFHTYAFDAVTVAPYMGEDSVAPFIKEEGKWAIVLGLTSNKGAEDIQQIKTEDGPVYLQAMKKMASWADADRLMFVVGATRAEKLKELREAFPEYFFLVPGVGAQGGDLKEVMRAGLNDDCGLLINASRSIIFAGDAEDYALKAGQAAREMQEIMTEELERVTN